MIHAPLHTATEYCTLRKVSYAARQACNIPDDKGGHVRMRNLWRYTLRNMLRHRVRSILTIFGISLSVFIVTYLASIFDSRRQLTAGTSETTLIVHEKDVY